MKHFLFISPHQRCHPCPVHHKAQFISSCTFRPKAQCKLLMLPIRQWESPLVPHFSGKLPATLQNLIMNVLKESLAYGYLYSFVATAIFCFPYLLMPAALLKITPEWLRFFPSAQQHLRELGFSSLYGKIVGEHLIENKKGGKTLQLHNSTSAPAKEKNE